VLPSSKLGASKKGATATNLKPIVEEKDENVNVALERQTMEKLENLQSSVAIDGECKLTLNYHDPETNIQGHIPGLSQELSSSRVEPKTFQFDKVFGPEFS